MEHKRLVQLAQGYNINDFEAPIVLRPLVSRLRRKLEVIPGLNLRIINIRGQDIWSNAINVRSDYHRIPVGFSHASQPFAFRFSGIRLSIPISRKLAINKAAPSHCVTESLSPSHHCANTMVTNNSARPKNAA